jgi:hypothetical protein
MPGKIEQGGLWKQISVVIRADIMVKAAEMNLDISNACNRALADLTGIDYPKDLLALPVAQYGIIPGPDAPVPKSRTRVLHPVINADDPSAVVKLMKTTRPHNDKPVPEPPFPAGKIPEVAPVLQVERKPGPATAGKGKTPEKERKRKDDTLKKFVTEKIIRVDSESAAISKDDMYQAFSRWCRVHRCSAVPDQKAFGTLLKNKFAIADKTVNGTPSWLKVQLK